MINTEEFRNLIREVVRDELGDRTRYKIAEIASVGDKVSVIFSGEPEPAQKEYTYLKSYHPAVGDRVWLARDKGTYVVLGKIDQYDVPMSGSNENGHWVRYPDGTQICRVQGMDFDLGSLTSSGNVFRTSTGRWTFPMPFIDSDVTVTGTANSFVRWFGTGGSPSTNDVSVLQFGTNSGTSYTMNVMATGRWKE